MKYRTARDELLSELIARFKGGFFRKSEKYIKNQRDGIWISKNSYSKSGSRIIEEGEVHPDLEILLEKYDAWVEPHEPSDGFFVFIHLNHIQQERSVKLNKNKR